MKPISLHVTADQIKQLETIVAAPTSENRLCQRAQIILMTSRHQSATFIAHYLHLNLYVVTKWRKRFNANGINGLFDEPRSGKPVKYRPEVERQILAVLDLTPPDGNARWNGKLIAQHLGNVSPDYVWRIMHRHGISLERKASWCISTDPEFAAKATDIVGLYLNPPTNALVLCVDEKPNIQALSRQMGWLNHDGKTMLAYSDRYERNGTTNLYAALNVATGNVDFQFSKRKTRRNFLDFMNALVKDYPERELHVVLDNLSAHSKKDDRWLQQHPLVKLHFTPTNASWLNQVEVFFSILTKHALDNASFHSVKQLRDAIEKYIKGYNEHSAPFEWKKTCVNPVKLQKTYSELRN